MARVVVALRSLLSRLVSFFFLLCLWKLNLVTCFFGLSSVSSCGIFKVLLFFAFLLWLRKPSNGDFLGEGLSKFLVEAGDVIVEAGDVTPAAGGDDVINWVSTSIVVGAWYPGAPSLYEKEEAEKQNVVHYSRLELKRNGERQEKQRGTLRMQGSFKRIRVGFGVEFCFLEETWKVNHNMF